jgi:hypothetical protein
MKLINNTLVNIHRAWSSLDYILYEHFHKKLKDLLSKQTQDFQDELQEYKSLKEGFGVFCKAMCKDFAGYNVSNIAEIRHVLKTSVTFTETKHHSAFRLTYMDCLLAISPEFINKILVKVKQFPNACASRQTAHSVGLYRHDCQFQKHVYPGYHVEMFKKYVLNTTSCLFGGWTE